MKLGLDAMRRALAALDHPELQLPTRVHIAGTNGKGTTAAALTAILHAHGAHTGLYTSPHLIDVCERMRLDGVSAPRAQVFAIGQALLDRFGQPDSDPRLSFFELTTLMALVVFARAKVDIALLEVGLGGRLDAVNAITPTACIITTLGYDHQQQLGDTLESIAREKAGILRGPQTLTLIGHQEHPEAARALKVEAPWALRYGDDFEAASAGQGGALRCSAGTVSPAPDAPWRLAPYQRAHAALACEAAARLLGPRFEPASAARGLASLRWPARLELREVTRRGSLHGARLLLDAAHNVDGMRALIDALDAPDAPTVGAIVCAGMADKALEAMFAPLLERGVPVFGALLEELPRAADAERLARALAGVSYQGAAPLERALIRAAAQAKGAVVLVCGSIYLLGACMALAGFDADHIITPPAS